MLSTRSNLHRNGGFIFFCDGDDFHFLGGGYHTMHGKQQSDLQLLGTESNHRIAEGARMGVWHRGKCILVP